MKKNTYFVVTSLLFFVVTMVHLSRVAFGWEVNIGAFYVPMWLSWVAVFGIGFLSLHGYRFSRKI